MKNPRERPRKKGPLLCSRGELRFCKYTFACVFLKLPVSECRARASFSLQLCEITGKTGNELEASPDAQIYESMVMLPKFTLWLIPVSKRNY